jgi:hypothetical protein
MPASGLAREIERYVARTPKSRALQQEAEGVLPGGSSRGTAYFAPYPFPSSSMIDETPTS